MKVSAMDCWIQHCCRHFQQDSKDCILLHPRNPRKLHIDMLLFKPNTAYPFWKLCTMGASDYKLPLTFCKRNEFVMFLHKDEDLQDENRLMWYCDVLLSVALYPAQNHFAITFGHSIIWGKQAGTDMNCAYLELPYPISSTDFAKCRLGPMTETMCLQVILLTQEESRQLLDLGPQKFYDFLYPSDGKAHFLCERYRSSRF